MMGNLMIKRSGTFISAVFVTGCLVLLLTNMAMAGKISPPFKIEKDPFTVSGYFDRLKSDQILLAQVGNDAVEEVSFDTESEGKSTIKGRKSVKKAFIMSLVVPGSGQYYVGSKTKAAIFFGIEALGWIGHITYHNKGDDNISILNAFADLNWSRTRYADYLWINWQTRDDDSAYNFPGDPSSGFFFGHHLPDSPTQQYYEMIGKYNQFVYGWADVTPLLGSDPTAHTTAYSQMRMDYEDMKLVAEKNYDRATTSLIVIMLNHVASSVEAALAARGHNKNVERYTQRMTFRAKMVSTETDYFPMLSMTYRF